MIKVFKNDLGKQLVLESYDRLLKLWGADIREQDIKTPFGKTHIITAGSSSNPPLLLFHGVGDNSALMWIYNIKELLKHFYVIAVDTIGGPGKSEPDENYGRSFDQCVWIDALLDDLNIIKVKIAGVSNGAYFSQHYTVKRPDRVERCVCMAGSVAVQSKFHALLRMLKVFFPEVIFPSEKNVRKLMGKLCGSNPGAFTHNEELMKHWYYLLKYSNPMAMKYHRLARLDAGEIDILSSRALFLIGDCDRLVYSQDGIDALKDNNINFKIIHGAGHGINHEQAELINREIIDFLFGNESAGGRK